MSPHNTSNGVSRSSLGMIQDNLIDAGRPLRVVCIGGGISGICTGIRFPQQIKNLDLVIYEKNSELGGTWHENTYPGVRCDIPSAGYQFTFENNPEWTEFLSDGPEIQRYLLRTAKKYGVYKYCKFNHRFKRAVWQAESGKWHVEIEDLLSQETFIDVADVLVTATGILNKWAWPAIPGIMDFEGKKAHTACWDETIDLDNKNVAVIGGGSSGIQLVSTIQPRVKHMDHYMKGKNWISPMGLGGGELVSRGVTSGNFKHKTEEIEKFKTDPKAYMEFRRRVEQELNAAQLAVFMGTQSQKDFFKMASNSHKEKLKDRPDIYHALTPEWVPGCRRLTPGPGYLEACCAPNVDFISTGIKRITKNGIETVDGKVREVDVICCATGFDVQRKELEIVGQDGKTLTDIWNPYPEAYLSVCPPSMPNLFMYLGPNGGPLAGSTVHMIEWVCDYMISLIKKIQRDYIKSMVVSPSANKAFSDHVNQYFKRTIFTQECASWYKQGKGGDSRVVTPWPGSAIHARRTFQIPRFEDFNYELLPEVENNCLAWLGNGMTQAQMEGGDTTDYLDEVIPMSKSLENGAAHQDTTVVDRVTVL